MEVHSLVGKLVESETIELITDSCKQTAPVGSGLSYNLLATSLNKATARRALHMHRIASISTYINQKDFTMWVQLKCRLRSFRSVFYFQS